MGLFSMLVALAVPFFKWAPGLAFSYTDWVVFDWMGAMGELPPAFACSGAVVILVSLMGSADSLAEA